MRRMTTITALSTATLLGAAICSPAALAKDAPPITDDSATEEHTTEEHTTEDSILAEAVEAGEELESLHSDLSMDLDIDAEYRSHHYQATMTGKGATDFSDGHYYMSATGDGEYESFQFYADGERAFGNNNALGWYELPTGDLASEGEGSSYRSVLADLESIEDDLDISQTGTGNSPQVTVRYSGNDREVFDAFAETFSMSWDGYRQADTSVEVEAVFDAETMHMTTFDFSVESDTVWGSDAMSISAEYSEFDEIDPIEIPSWVLDTAERNGQTDDWFEDEGIEEEELEEGLGIPGSSERDETAEDKGDEDDEAGEEQDGEEDPREGLGGDSRDRLEDDPWASHA